MVEEFLNRSLNDSEYFFSLCIQYFSPFVKNGFESKQETDRDGACYFELSNKNIRINFSCNVGETLSVSVGPNAIGTMRRTYDLFQLLQEMNVNVDKLPIKKSKQGGCLLDLSGKNTELILSDLAEKLHQNLNRIQSEIKKRIERDGYRA